MTEEKLVTVGVIIKDKPNLDTFKVIGFRVFSIVDASLFDISIREFFEKYSYVRVRGLDKDEKSIKIDVDEIPYLELSIYSSLNAYKNGWFLSEGSMYPLIYNGDVVGNKRIVRLVTNYYLVKNVDSDAVYIYINMDNGSIGLKVDDFNVIDTFDMGFDKDSVADIEVANSLDCDIFGADTNNSGLYVYDKNAVVFMRDAIDTLIIPSGIENLILSSRISLKLKRVVFPPSLKTVNVTEFSSLAGYELVFPKSFDYSDIEDRAYQIEQY
jgi:hypothetical protein